jgi:hypothetical protein
VQIEQPKPAIHDITFRNIWALSQPPLIPSSIEGSVSGVVFDNIKLGQTRLDSPAALPLTLTADAASPAFPPPSGPVAAFTVSGDRLEPGRKITFTAAKTPHARYTWLFGDGTTAQGRRVKHRFPDASGTALDARNGAGRFRVLLHVETSDKSGQKQDWAAQSIVVVDRWHEAVAAPGAVAAGLAWRLYPGAFAELPDLAHQTAAFSGPASGLTLDPHGFTRFAAAWEGLLDVPADGGYSFHLMSRDGARLVIDGLEVARTGPPFAQVCGAPGNAVRYDVGALGLRRGLHSIHVEGLRTASDDLPRLLWEGPGLPLAPLPATALVHTAAPPAVR